MSDPDPDGTIRVHPDDDPADPGARRVVLTSQSSEVPWFLISGHDRRGGDCSVWSDNDIGIGLCPNGARIWPLQVAVESQQLSTPPPDRVEKNSAMWIGDAGSGHWPWCVICSSNGISLSYTTRGDASPSEARRLAAALLSAAKHQEEQCGRGGES